MKGIHFVSSIHLCFAVGFFHLCCNAGLKPLGVQKSGGVLIAWSQAGHWILGPCDKATLVGG